MEFSPWNILVLVVTYFLALQDHVLFAFIVLLIGLR
jgi:hypothetical protein